MLACTSICQQMLAHAGICYYVLGHATNTRTYEHTLDYASICQHMLASANVRYHMLAYGSIRGWGSSPIGKSFCVMPCVRLCEVTSTATLTATATGHSRRSQPQVPGHTAQAQLTLGGNRPTKLPDSNFTRTPRGYRQDTARVPEPC